MTDASTIESFFHAPTYTYSYVVADPQARRAAVIDPVLDYDPAAARIRTAPPNEILTCLREHGLSLDWILETHAHADHVTAAQHLKSRYPQARVAIGAGIRAVQATFRESLQPRRGLPRQRHALRPPVRGRRRHSRSGACKRACSAPPAIPATASPTSSAVTPSSATRCSCPTSAPRAATFPAAMRRRCSGPYSAFMRCRDGHRPVHVPRLSARRPRSARSHDGRRTEGAQRARARRRLRARLRLAARTRDETLAMPQLIVPAIQINIRAGHGAGARDERHRLLESALQRTLSTGDIRKCKRNEPTSVFPSSAA